MTSLASPGLAVAASNSQAPNTRHNLIEFPTQNRDTFLIQPPFIANEAQLGRSDDRGVGDANGCQRAIEIMAPEIQKLDQPRKFRCEIVILPDKHLQKIAMIGHAIHDLCCCQTPTTQL